jgi:hypothetical protein
MKSETLISIHKIIWNAILNLSRVVSNRYPRLIKQTLRVGKKLLEKYDRSWGRYQAICVRVDNFVRWCYDGPRKPASLIETLSTW